jgi:hypothetical protein
MGDPAARSVRERIENDDLFLDSAIDSHGFAPYMRDYDVVIDVPAATPDGQRSYIMGRYRYRFTHCPETAAHTEVRPDVWRRSWEDVLTDPEALESTRHLPAFHWAVSWAAAYPGMTYVNGSERARRWAEEFGREMHEVRIVSNVLDLSVVFHDLRIRQLAVGDPDTGLLTEIP